MKSYENSDLLISDIAKISPETMLSFSGGKDAIAAWLAMRGKFERIVPYYMYLIPDLEFVNESLVYYERFFQTKIYQYPNPALYRMLNAAVLQPPDRLSVIDNFGFEEYDRDDVSRACIEDSGINPLAYTAIGNRINDNLVRRMSFNRFGAVNEKRRTYWPVYDWKNERLTDEFRKAGIQLPVDYRMFGRSFDGLNIRYLYPIKQNFPSDYQKILEWFPLADLEVFRYEHQL
jgi:hypothetical protein